MKTTWFIELDMNGKDETTVTIICENIKKVEGSHYDALINDAVEVSFEYPIKSIMTEEEFEIQYNKDFPKSNDVKWENFGYDSKSPCVVCGATGNNKSEPRFGYVVCKEHSTLSPVEISELKGKK